MTMTHSSSVCRFQMGGHRALKDTVQNTFRLIKYIRINFSLCTCTSFSFLLSNCLFLFNNVFILLLYFLSTNKQKQFVYPGEIRIMRLYGCYIAYDLQLSRYISLYNLSCPPPSHTHTKSKLFPKDKITSGEMVSEAIISLRGDQYQDANKEKRHQNAPIKRTRYSSYLLMVQRSDISGSECSFKSENIFSSLCVGFSIHFLSIKKGKHSFSVFYSSTNHLFLCFCLLSITKRHQIWLDALA